MLSLNSRIESVMSKTYRASRDLCITKISEYCLAINETNRYYLDQKYAQKGKYGSIIAPPAFVEIIAKKAWSGIYKTLEWDPNLVLMCTYKMKCKRLIRPYMYLTVNAKITDYKIKKKYYFLYVCHVVTNDNSQLVAELDVVLAYPIN